MIRVAAWTGTPGRTPPRRYARPGDVLGIAVLVGGPASVGVQAVEPSGLFRLSSRTLLAAARRDARVSWAIAPSRPGAGQRPGLPGRTKTQLTGLPPENPAADGCA